MVRFPDRREAGRLLAGLLREFASSDSVTVIALSTHGLPVAEEVATALRAPLQLFEHRKYCTFRSEIAPREQATMRLRGYSVILIDDGFGNAATLKEAAVQLRREFPRRIIAAAPVALLSVASDVGGVVDRFVALAAPRPFHSVAFWYDDSPWRHVPVQHRHHALRLGGAHAIC